MEMGSRNHEIVPTQLINTLSKMGPCAKILKNLAKNKLIAYEATAKCKVLLILV
jgi:RIO-like serine/threonine protein kinase